MPAARAAQAHDALVVVACPRTDRQILDALESVAVRLTASERNAFGRMRRGMLGGRILALSYAQRAWAQEVAARFGFEVEHPGNWRETSNEIHNMRK